MASACSRRWLPSRFSSRAAVRRGGRGGDRGCERVREHHGAAVSHVDAVSRFADVPREGACFQILDHSAIYFLIAGNLHTIYARRAGAVIGAGRYSGLVWGFGCRRYGAEGARRAFVTRPASTWMYLVMGWLVLIAAKTVWTLVPAWGLFLAGGGRASLTTAGAVFFMSERIRYFSFRVASLRRRGYRVSLHRSSVVTRPDRRARLLLIGSVPNESHCGGRAVVPA